MKNWWNQKVSAAQQKRKRKSSEREMWIHSQMEDTRIPTVSAEERNPWTTQSPWLQTAIGLWDTKDLEKRKRINIVHMSPPPGLCKLTPAPSHSSCYLCGHKTKLEMMRQKSVRQLSSGGGRFLPRRSKCKVVKLKLKTVFSWDAVFLRQTHRGTIKENKGLK